MPLVQVNLLRGRSAEEKGSSAASIQTALVSARHRSAYLGMTYTDRLLIIEIALLEGRGR